MRRYRVNVTIAQCTDHDSVITYQIPTFDYDANILGLLSAEQAQGLAEVTFQQLLPNAGISACAVEV